jgi:hypothetical protein
MRNPEYIKNGSIVGPINPTVLSIFGAIIAKKVPIRKGKFKNAKKKSSSTLLTISYRNIRRQNNNRSYYQIDDSTWIQICYPINNCYCNCRKYDILWNLKTT